MRLPRFRIWVLMTAVAVVAFAVWGGLETAKLYRLSVRYQQMAEFCALHVEEDRSAIQRSGATARIDGMQGQYAERYIATYGDTLGKYAFKQAQEDIARAAEAATTARNDIAEYEREANYYKTLEAKYKCAASYPWRPLAPDPPPPTLSLSFMKK